VDHRVAAEDADAVGVLVYRPKRRRQRSSKQRLDLIDLVSPCAPSDAFVKFSCRSPGAQNRIHVRAAL
jgi:hypothetical protein